MEFKAFVQNPYALQDRKYVSFSYHGHEIERLSIREVLQKLKAAARAVELADKFLKTRNEKVAKEIFFLGSLIDGKTSAANEDDLVYYNELMKFYKERMSEIQVTAQDEPPGELP